MDRRTIASLAAGAVAFVGILMSEGYRGEAYTPVAGDVPTIGFGTTQGVRHGDTITPEKALARALQDVNKFEGVIKQCVRVPLHQYEYDAFVSLAYNIGGGAFCGSSLVRKLNAGDYAGACAEILRWDKFKGKPLAGLTNRRGAEYRQCTGGRP